jgi:hypothetical protein
VMADRKEDDVRHAPDDLVHETLICAFNAASISLQALLRRDLSLTT